MLKNVSRSLATVLAVFLTSCEEAPYTTRTIDFEVSEGMKLAFDLSPDGQTIAFDLLGQLRLLPADGGVASPITDAVRDTADDAGPTFSPDGHWIAFQSDRNESGGYSRVASSWTERNCCDWPEKEVASWGITEGHRLTWTAVSTMERASA